MTAQETTDVASQELEQKFDNQDEKQWRKGETNKDKEDEDGKTNEVEESSSPTGVFDTSHEIQGTLWTTTSVVHKALSPDNYNLPFTIFIDAVRNSSVKKISTSTLALITGYDLSKRTVRRKLARIRNAEDAIDCGLVRMKKQCWRNFDYDELASATHNFSHEELLGQGGHASVYKGCLADGTLIAVKKLHTDEEVDDDSVKGFLSELGVIAHVDHSNVAKLVGFVVDNGLYLVLEFAHLGSLASQLYVSREGLKWDMRYRVALSVAEGLAYLHHTCHRRIIHRDIKASNILLGDDFEPIISDFGLAKWLPEKWTNHVIHPVEGTLGYLAPEYFMHGIVDEKTDVFAFGVVLLELLTGRYAVDSRHPGGDDSRQSLVMWVKPLLDSCDVNELIDPQLGDEYVENQFRRVRTIAAMCIHHEPIRRPHMNRVVEMLKGEGKAIEMKQCSIHPRSMLIDMCNEDYTRSNYLQDLSRHKELLME